MTVTLVVFGVAVLLWVCTPLDDTFVALAAVAALLLFGVLPASSLAALGGATTWLLLAAFVLAAGVTASGLTTRLATWLVGRARTVRGLAHLVSLGLLLSAFFVPSTSGRAALALPVFGALAEGLHDRRRVVRALGVLFPSVILLTAVATLVGAGAHLITNSLLETATGHGIGFGWWLLLGVPLAVVSAHLTAEIVLWLFTTREDRARPLHGGGAGGGAASDRARPLHGGGAGGGAASDRARPLQGGGVGGGAASDRARPLQGGGVGGGAASDRARPSHAGTARGGAADDGCASDLATLELPVPALAGARPAGAAAARSEGPLQGVPCSDSPTQHRQFRTLELPQPKPTQRRTLTRPEWTALTVVLAVSAAWLTEPWHHIPPEVSALTGALLITAPRIGTTTFKAAFAEVPWSLLVFMAATTALGTALIKSGAADLAASHLGGTSDLHLLATVIAVSLAAHLVIQSRSARSSVLIPIVVPLALAAGLNPAALAFASTAAAGFCHTLTSSAKPVALFADAYRPKDLLKLSAVLAPVTGLLVFAAAVLLWPHLGLPLK